MLRGHLENYYPDGQISTSNKSKLYRIPKKQISVVQFLYGGWSCDVLAVQVWKSFVKKLYNFNGLS